MITPEITYQFTTPKDLASGSCDLITRYKETTATYGTNIGTELLYQVPKDRVFILSTAGILSLAAAGTTVKEVYFRFEVDGNPNASFIFGRKPDGDNTAGFTGFTGPRGSTTFSGELWLPPGAKLYAVGWWTAQAVNNAILSFCSGISIPRGNVQQA